VTTIRARVESAVARSLESLRARGVLPDLPPNASAVSPCKDEKHGDFACNAAMALAKAAKRKPAELAAAIREELLAGAADLVMEAEVAGPGFLNLRLHPRVLQEVVLTVLADPERWGQAEPSGQRVNVEFTSANPTGPLHVAHGRGTVLGDALCRLLRAAGDQVTAEYYINDAGNQVETLGRSVFLRYRELLGEAVGPWPPDAYPGAYVVDIAREVLKEHGEALRDAPPERWRPLCVQAGIRFNMAWIRKDLQAFKVEHKVFASEQALHDTGAVKGLARALAERGVTYEADQAQGVEGKKRREESKAAKHVEDQHGGTFLRTSAHGDEEDRVILRRDGSPVYLLADLCYHGDKFARGHDRVIDVWGADHGGHVTRMRAGLRAMGLDDKRFEIVLVQMVRLLRDGQEVRISKRTGNLLLLSELIDEIGPDAARYYFLMRSPNSTLDVDLDKAREQSLDNPVIYAQYGHARCCAIFRKALERGITPRTPTAAELAALTLPEELALLRRLAAFPDRVREAARALEPHRLVYELNDLNQQFHAYYTKYGKTERVVSDDAVKTAARLGLVTALQVTMARALAILGVSAPERMELPQADEEAGG
jgi:arginyl-tRNA synthetase